MNVDKNERIAIVTGSSSGIGFETAVALARNGFYTYATMRNLNKSKSIVELARREELGLEALYLDVTDHKSIAEAIDKITSKQQRLDVLVIMQAMHQLDHSKSYRFKNSKNNLKQIYLVSSELHNQYYQ
jgi:NAD(P)-dependent dehydrogenase (short-subunit alcohol dehydrogenase family)